MLIFKFNVEIASKRRKDDVVIVIVQDNDNKKVFIENINEAAEVALCYDKDDLIGCDLFKILDDELQKKIMFHIEFEQYGIAIDSILAKTKNIHLVGRDGQRAKVKVKIFPTVSDVKNRMRFEILARTLDYIDELALFRESVGHYEYSIDDTFKVMNSEAVKKEISILSSFTEKYNVDCIANFIELREFTYDFAAYVIKILKSNIRIYDEVGMLNNHIVLFLIGCKKDDVGNVFKRLLNKINRSIKVYFYNLREYPIYEPSNQIILDIKKFADQLV